MAHDARRKGIKHLRYEVANGGGSTTYQEFERQIDAGAVVVCVCDTDKYTPFCQESETLRRVRQSAQGRTFAGRVFGTPCREVENFLPLHIIRQLDAGQNEELKNTLQGLVEDQQEPLPGECLWLYFDIKEGVAAEDLQRKCTAGDPVSWVEDRYQIESLQEAELELDGFGSNVVGRFLREPTLLAELHRFVRSGYWLRHFSGWFEDVLPFFLGKPQVRI